jgi:hypothetical protein
MRKTIKLLFFLFTLATICFQNDWLSVGTACGAQQDRKFLAKQRLRRILLDVEIELEKNGNKLAANSSKEKVNLDPTNPITLSGEFNDKDGVTVGYIVFFHEDVNMVDRGYLGFTTPSSADSIKSLKGIGDKATEIILSNGNQIIVFKRGSYVVSLAFPSKISPLSIELANKWITAIDKHGKP